MIGQVAENCYWTARYLERAETLARILLVNHLFSLSNTHDLFNDRHPIWLSHGDDTEVLKSSHHTEIISEFIWNTENEDSLHSIINQARRAAKNIREVLNESKWQTLNELYLWLSDSKTIELSHHYPTTFYNHILTKCQLFKGYFYNSSYRDKYFHVMEIGIQLERIMQTLDMAYRLYKNWFAHKNQVIPAIEVHKYWGFFLDLCSSRESFLNENHSIETNLIIQHIINNKFSPYSIQFCMDKINENIHMLNHQDDSPKYPSIHITTLRDKLHHMQTGSKIISLSDLDKIIEISSNINEFIHTEYFYQPYKNIHIDMNSTKEG